MVDTKENYKFDLRVIGLKGSVKGDSCLFALVLNNTNKQRDACLTFWPGGGGLTWQKVLIRVWA